MRAHSSLYVHPELTDSDIWGPDNTNRKPLVVYSVLSGVTLMVLSSLALYQFDLLPLKELLDAGAFGRLL